MRFHQNNLLALSATPSKPKIDYTKFVMNFNGDTQYIFHTSYDDQYCGVSWIEDVLLDGQPYQKDYATLYSTYNSLARAPGGGAAGQIVDTGGSNFIHTIEIKFKEGFEFRNINISDFDSTIDNPYLLSIEFQDNITQVIATGLFKNCSQLEEINWNNVKLKNAYMNIFLRCTNIKEIDFSTCMDRSNRPEIVFYFGLIGVGIIPSNTTQLTKIVMPMGAEDIPFERLSWTSSDTSAQYPNNLAGTFYYNEKGDYSKLLQYLSPTWTAVPMKFD